MSTDKKDTRNQLTRDAGLVFNVNTMKSSMISFFKNQDLYFTVTNAEGEVSRKLPMFKGSQVAMTAALEQLCRLLFNNVLQYTNRDKSGLRTVTRPVLKYSVFLHKGLNEYYNYRLNSFNKNQVYKEQVPFREDEIVEVMNVVDRKLTFTPKAFNLLCFLLSDAYLEILRTSYDFISFAKKRTLDPRAVSCSIKNRFPDLVNHELCNELSRACAAVGNDIDKNDDEEDDDEEEDEVKEEEVKSKGKSGGKSTKSAKSKKVEQVDEESDDEIESDEESDEESVEEVVARKPSKKAGSNTKGKKARKARRV